MNPPLISQKPFLKTVGERKRREVESAKRDLPLSELRARVDTTDPPRNFLGIFSRGFVCIAEIKKASPSAGNLTDEFRPEQIAREYERGGASAISVVTDSEFFGGSKEHLRKVKEVSSIPVLRKEFIIDEYQIYEARVLGADAILLISELLTEDELRRFMTLSKELGMASLVEGHTVHAIEKAVIAGAQLIGVNNRDLNTFSLEPDTSFLLKPLIPDRTIAISESGIKTSEDLHKLREAGYRGALIGESLMILKDREKGLRRFLESMRNP